ncbi:MAG: Fe(2+)-trafficking protein [Holophagales bacterium]|nr:Fe(2+)-trafficking protein [Holophagales bacterium]
MSDSQNLNVTCTRCQSEGPGAQNVVYGGSLGEEIRSKVCDDCWREWVGMEVMVINELRLNFMDPKSQDVLVEHLRQFLVLDGGGEKPDEGILAGPPTPAGS